MFRYTIRPDGGEQFEVVATSRDVSKWERVTKGANFQNIIETKSMLGFTQIAFYAAVRHGQWAGTLAEFLDGVDLDVDDSDAGAEDPTQSAA